MKSKLVVPLFITTFLLTEYSTFNVVQANPPVLIAQSIWKSFSSEEGGFTVLMPGSPTEDQRDINTKVGAVPINLFYVARPNEALYGVAYADLPKDVSLNSLDINQLLNSFASGFAQGSGGRIVSQKTIRIGDFPGREIRLQYQQGEIGRGRIFLANKRLYQVVVITSKESSLTKSIEGFFKSFRIVNNETGPRKPTPEELNANLKQAVCSQNWSQALKVIDQMIAIASPEVREQLVSYRSRLQGLANSGSKIPPESLPECAANR
ncbi:MAG: hypothetical protein AB1589_16755 [Cyanobacteriota bacterium]